MRSRIPRFFKRPRVIGATVLAVLFGLSTPKTFITTFVIAWVAGYAVAWLAGRVWWNLTYPPVPSWARRSGRRLTARMLREDVNATVFSDRKGFLFRRRYWFVGTGCPPTPISPRWFDTLAVAHHGKPMPVVRTSERVWWWFGDRFYWENQGYSAEDVMALVRERERRQERQLKRAHDMLVLDRDPTHRREPIPQAVRRAVFERDGGHCVQCGSTFDLQYDHILPVALGGATTVANLQLLCSECNRDKSDSL